MAVHRAKRNRLPLDIMIPAGDGWNVQGFEAGLSLRAGAYVEGFTTLHLGYNHEEDKWEDEWEEYFLKIKNIPGGIQIKGGKFYDQFGLHNATHLHGWDWANQYAVSGRFLGEDALAIEGGAISWDMPTPWRSVLGVSLGRAPSLGHGHSHGHGEDEHEEEGGHHGEHDDHEEDHHEEEEHGHEIDRDQFMGFQGDIATVNWTNQFDYNDFHQFRSGLAGAWGKTPGGSNQQLYGIHFEYQWRENGYEAGGQYFRWRTEVMGRYLDVSEGDGEEAHGEEEGHEDHDHHGEHEDHEDEENRAHARMIGNHSEFGLYSTMAYSWDPHWEISTRGEYVSGIGGLDLDERWRLGAGIAWFLNENRTMAIRLQYDYDHSNEYGSSHGVWAQFSLNWGGPEVR
jgi:hypothetical protein